MKLLVGLLAMAPLACSPTTYVHGVPNLQPVDPIAEVYRSGQPSSPEAWEYVKALGVTVVVKLNRESEGSDDAAERAGLTVVKIPMPPSSAGEVLEAPSAADIRRAVEAMRAGHVLLHCEHGQDRTGLVAAAYRVLVDGWSRSAARREMLAAGFHVELLGLDDAWEDLAP